jgi:uncharacterized protein (DUF305 family)
VKKLAIGAALAASLMLTGCAADSANHDSMNHSDSTQKMTAEAMFVVMMVPHHEQALEMVALAEKNTTNSAILKLSEGIKNAQTAEVTQFKKYIDDNGITSEPMAMESGLLTDEEMAALESATGSEFDALFLEGMIKHHQGAVDMATPLLESTDSQIAKWAQGIFVSQQSEILVMQALQRKL